MVLNQVGGSNSHDSEYTKTALDAIKAWKQNVEHLNAQQLGRDKWYSAFTTRIAKVERDYSL